MEADRLAANAVRSDQHHLEQMQGHGDHASYQAAIATLSTTTFEEDDPQAIASTSASGIQFTNADMHRMFSSDTQKRPQSPDKAAGQTSIADSTPEELLADRTAKRPATSQAKDQAGGMHD